MLTVKTFCVTITEMSEIQKHSDDDGTTPAKQESKDKVSYAKWSDLFLVSVYDVVTWIGIAIVVGLVLMYGFQKNWHAFSWSVLALFLLMLAMLTIRALQHKKSIEAGSRQIIDRPELSIERVYVKILEAGKPEIVNMEIQNRGKLTALNVAIHGTLVHEYTTFKGPLIHKPTDPQIVNSIAPGATITCAFHSTWINTAEDVETIKSGKIQLFHFGKAHYEDQAGKKYPLDYCFLYDPSVPRSMMISPAQYWPKDGALPQSTPTRPELFVERATAELVPGKPKRVAVEFVNRGNGEAKHLTVWMNQGLAKPDFPGPLKFEALEPDTRPSIGPNGTVTLVGGKNEPITTAEYEAIQHGTRVWFIFGKGVYEDSAGSSWPIDFCFQYEPSIAPVMRICPDKYWPKQVEPKTVPEHRPELSLEYAKGICLPGKPARVDIGLQNRGNATAHQIAMVATNFFVLARYFQGPMETEPSEAQYIYPSLAPGAMMEGHTETDKLPLTIQDVADIMDKKLLFLHYSKGSYKDKQGNEYTIDFCLLYDPAQPEAMRIAPKAYWPRSLSDF